MFEGVTKVHFVGIGGIGISALAKFFVRRGASVTGSDLVSSSLTQELEAMGVLVRLGHAVENVPDGVDLLVYSPAVSDSNVERSVARERGVRELSYPEALGELSREYSTIAVCGTNGKSTTTAMLGAILVEAGYDPTVIVGTKVPSFPDGNLRMGKGRFLVVEACEYREHFLHLNPEMIVVTNIEEDHLDYFRDLDHIREAFQTFVDKLRGKGLVIWNASDPQSKKLSVDRGVTFGDGVEADYDATSIPLRMRIPGRFNVMNALAAYAAARELGVPDETCTHVLESFTGVWRRFERVGEWKGADVFSDYGHHPTAVASTVDAARAFFPQRRIVLCFQPHQHARTKTLFDGFVKALAHADALVVPEIYDVAGREEVRDVSSKDLVEKINATHPGKDARYAKDLDDAEAQLRDIVQPGDVLIFQGAGDIDTLARRMVI
jgi:UDP-N-acetylmuramate--alanine ligase